MFEFLSRLFDTSDFPARWHCGAWTSGHGWLHIISDLGVWAAYVTIPCVLAYFAIRRRDLPFRSIFYLFIAFILCCGTTHLMEAIIFWWPAYRLAGVIKLITALVSWATVIALIPTTPKILALRSPQELEREIADRKRAEEELRKLHVELEARVAQRTTELARANAALQVEVSERSHAEEALKEADRRKDQFLAILAHELRNPLAPISNALELWPRVEHDHGQMEMLRTMIERQTRQMVRLVDDLLDVSRITRGKIQLRLQPVDVANIVNGALEAARPLINQCGHQLTVSLPEQPLYINGDVARLLQACGNILHNAAKYTGRNGSIWVSAQREGELAVIRIRDNGPGIPPEMLAKVFEMFTQVDQTLDRAFGGLGIGLTLAKTLVEIQGGSVEAQSDGPGCGSEFIVRLPVLEQPVPATSHQESAPPAASGGVPSHRIVVVDDISASAKTLAMMLKAANQEVEVFVDGPTAIEAIRATRPDIVFLDIAMPGMDGYEVARRLRQMTELKGLVIVALTGYGQDDDRRKTQAAGFDYHLVKPTSIDTLEQLLSCIPAGDHPTRQ
ncbi:MAG: response regulator [Planctomycetes bacterium]|nr:response regulator [Planctomycetota bacterium]